MALNLTPEYFEADRKYRQATSPAEKLAALEEMLRAIPKHKASEKKQADIKRRISELRHAGPAQKKSGGPDPYHIPRQGGGQVMMFGPPNSGKSSIVGARTKAPVKITEFPYGTPLPVPGMAYHEDVPIELVDLPPVTPEHMPPGMINALRNADIIAVVVDLAADSVLEDIEAMLGVLAERDITFAPPDDAAGQSGDGQDDGLNVGPQGVIVGTRLDVAGAADNLQTLRELRPAHPPLLPVSSATGEGLDAMMRTFFDMLRVIRIYAKEPGKPPDKEKPFVLPVGSTVEELAKAIHKDLAARLKFARIWGEQGHPGMQVQSKHALHDRDTVEIHA